MTARKLRSKRKIGPRRRPAQAPEQPPTPPIAPRRFTPSPEPSAFHQMMGVGLPDVPKTSSPNGKKDDWDEELNLTAKDKEFYIVLFICLALVILLFGLIHWATK